MSKRTRSRAQQRRLKNLQATRATAATEQPKTWYRISNFVDAPDTAAIYLYGEIGYWGIEAQDFVRELMSLRVSNIVLHINSPGGEVFEGLAIYHALRDHPATVETRVDGLAASAASFIAMAGDTVVMQRNAQMMVHDASGIEIGNAQDMRTMADLLDKCSDNIADIYMQQAGGTVEAWRAVMKVETWYSADEALAAGLCDSVANADDETAEDVAVVPGDDDDPDELMDKAWDLTVFAYTYAGRDKAPAPKPVAELTAEDTSSEPVEPAAEGVTEPEPVAEPAPEEPASEPAAADTAPEAAAGEPEPEPQPDPADPADAGPANHWTALIADLLKPASSTVDELLHALIKEGTSA